MLIWWLDCRCARRAKSAGWSSTHGACGSVGAVGGASAWRQAFSAAEWRFKLCFLRWKVRNTAPWRSLRYPAGPSGCPTASWRCPAAGWPHPPSRSCWSHWPRPRRTARTEDWDTPLHWFHTCPVWHKQPYDYRRPPTLVQITQLVPKTKLGSRHRYRAELPSG